jgi:hypothetical protein
VFINRITWNKTLKAENVNCFIKTHIFIDQTCVLSISTTQERRDTSVICVVPHSIKCWHWKCMYKDIWVGISLMWSFDLNLTFWMGNFLVNNYRPFLIKWTTLSLSYIPSEAFTHTHTQTVANKISQSYLFVLQEINHSSAYSVLKCMLLRQDSSIICVHLVVSNSITTLNWYISIVCWSSLCSS